MDKLLTPGGHGLGWHPSTPDLRDYVYQAPACVANAPLPAAVDLRPHMPPVRDQGPLGSCTAFASTSLAWYVYMHEGFHNPFNPSELFQYYNTRAELGGGATGYDSGGTSRTAMAALAQYGMCAEHWWPYDIVAFTEQPPQPAYANATKHEATSYYAVPQTLPAMHCCIAEGYPFIVGIVVYASFEGPQAATTGLVPMPQPGETVLGGHEQCICGYDDARQVFISQNSWGPNYGDHGYMYLPYAYLASGTLAADLWTLRVQH